MLPAAQKQVRKLPQAAQVKIRDRVFALEFDPYPDGAERVKGLPQNVRRIREGGYRIVYEVRKQRLLIVIARVAVRGGVYDHLRDIERALKAFKG